MICSSINKLAKYTDKKLKKDVGLAPVKSSNFWLVEQTILDLKQMLELKPAVTSYDSPKMSGNTI